MNLLFQLDCVNVQLVDEDPSGAQLQNGSLSSLPFILK
jgi:hypothetical protein